MMKLKEKNEGITLVALVITIIIMIILAAITFSIVLGENGLIKKADEGSRNYVAAAEQERGLLNSIENYINNIDTTEDESTKLIETIQVGDYVAYNPTVSNAGGTINVNSNLLTYTSFANNGVANTPGSGYFIDNGSGSDLGQSFTANSTAKWRVFSIDESTGEILLISEEPIKTNANSEYYLKGAKGYLYAEKELNEICKIYGYGYGADTNHVTTYNYGFEPVDGELTGTITSGARSINADDIGRIAQNGGGTTMGVSPTISTDNGWQAETPDPRYMVYRRYIIEKYTDTSSKIYKLIYRNVSDNNYVNKYWISKRFEESDDSTWYQVSYISNDGLLSKETIAGYSSGLGAYENAFSASIRPIIILKKDIKTTGKNANGEWILK